jgi:hypothetical protein
MMFAVSPVVHSPAFGGTRKLQATAMLLQLPTPLLAAAEHVRASTCGRGRRARRSVAFTEMIRGWNAAGPLECCERLVDQNCGAAVLNCWGLTMSAIRIGLAAVGVALCNFLNDPASTQSKDTGTNMRPWTVTHGGTSSSAAGQQFKSSKHRAKSGRGLSQP